MCVLSLRCRLEDPTGEKTSGEQSCLGPRAPGEALCSLRSSEWGRCLAVFLHPSPGSPPALQPSLTTVGLPGPVSPTTPRLGCLGGPPITGCFESWAQACFPELESSGAEVI